MKSFISFEIYVKDVLGTASLLENLFSGEREYVDEGFGIIWLGKTRIILNLLNLEEFKQPNPILKVGALEHLGSGLEIVISVDDLVALHSKAKELIVDVTPIQEQPWGLKDFRMLLADGYYVRVTEPDSKVSEVW